jgi:hypothetical protein
MSDNQTTPMPYQVGTFRAAGLTAKWTKARWGAPFIMCQRADTGDWFIVDGDVWATMNKIGIAEGWEQHTALGHIFSIGV